MVAATRVSSNFQMPKPKRRICPTQVEPATMSMKSQLNPSSQQNPMPVPMSKPTAKQAKILLSKKTSTPKATSTLSVSTSSQEHQQQLTSSSNTKSLSSKSCSSPMDKEVQSTTTKASCGHLSPDKDPVRQQSQMTKESSQEPSQKSLADSLDQEPQKRDLRDSTHSNLSLSPLICWTIQSKQFQSQELLPRSPEKCSIHSEKKNLIQPNILDFSCRSSPSLQQQQSRPSAMTSTSDMGSSSVDTEGPQSQSLFTTRLHLTVWGPVNQEVCNLLREFSRCWGRSYPCWLHLCWTYSSLWLRHLELATDSCCCYHCFYKLHC